jgi:hypothetical protein
MNPIGILDHHGSFSLVSHEEKPWADPGTNMKLPGFFLRDGPNSLCIFGRVELPALQVLIPLNVSLTPSDGGQARSSDFWTPPILHPGKSSPAPEGRARGAAIDAARRIA